MKMTAGVEICAPVAFADVRSTIERHFFEMPSMLHSEHVSFYSDPNMLIFGFSSYSFDLCADVLTRLCDQLPIANYDFVICKM